MDRVEFLYAAVGKFGKRISLAPMNFPGHRFTIKAQSLSQPDNEELVKGMSSYPLQAWLLPKEGEELMTCPECNTAISGLFGSFEWGIIHGIGFCNKCKKVEFRYYHYVGKICLQAWAVAGFTQ